MNRFTFTVGFLTTFLVGLGILEIVHAGGGVPFMGNMEGMQVSNVALEPLFRLATVVIELSIGVSKVGKPEAGGKFLRFKASSLGQLYRGLRPSAETVGALGF